MNEITLGTTLRHSDATLSADVKGETVLVNLAGGRYYGMDEVGGVVWHRLANPTNVHILCDQLATEYDAPFDLVAADVLAFLRHLQNEGLVELVASES